ncbi:MAG: 50S ribosomal protein L33 [bacterium]|nr:50S ribosomal protein L33 [bacterium]
MRELITLACDMCKRRNYNYDKNKKAHPEKLELNKYCKFCKKVSLHKEIK